MRNKAATQEQLSPNTGEKVPRAHKHLVIISGRSKTKKNPAIAERVVSFLVTQERLARIQELQSRLAFEHRELIEEWKRIRSEMLAGAKVQPGPIRAWLQYSLRYTKRGSRKAKHHTKLIVR